MPPVGLDPVGADRLQRLLDDAAASLRGCAERVQRLLDETGIACTAPQVIRGVADTCGGTGADLGRRIAVTRASPPPVAYSRGGMGVSGHAHASWLGSAPAGSPWLAAVCGPSLAPHLVLSCHPPAAGREVLGQPPSGRDSSPGAGDRSRPERLVTLVRRPRPTFDQTTSSAEHQSDMRGQPVDEDPGEEAPPPSYEPSPKHDEKRPGVGPQPTSPEEVLKGSIDVAPGLRVGYNKETGEIVVFRETHPGKGIYHGYVSEHEQLGQELRNALFRAGLVNLRGKPMGSDRV